MLSSVLGKNKQTYLSFSFFFSFYIKRNLSQNSCGFYEPSLLFSPWLSAVRCVVAAHVWCPLCWPHCSGAACEAEPACRHSCSPFSVRCAGPGDLVAVPLYLPPSSLSWGQWGVLSQCDRGRGRQAECHPCSTRLPWQWPQDGIPWHVFVQMEKVSPGDSRLTWLPGSPGWSDEHSVGSPASASQAACPALWGSDLPILSVMIVFPIWNGFSPWCYCLLKLVTHIVLYSVESCEIANICSEL